MIMYHRFTHVYIYKLYMRFHLFNESYNTCRIHSTGTEISVTGVNSFITLIMVQFLYGLLKLPLLPDQCHLGCISLLLSKLCKLPS